MRVCLWPCKTDWITHPTACALKQSEDKLNSILNSVEAYIYIKGRDYTYHYANRQVCELFGRSLPEIVGTEDTAFFDEPTCMRIRENDRRVIEQGERVSEEELNTTVDGHVTRAFLSVKMPLRDASGEVYGLCGISTDITGRKRVEAELEQHRNLADQIVISPKPPWVLRFRPPRLTTSS